MACVNIVISDRGWILERLATEIANRYSYVKFGAAPDPGASINYYMTYSSWRRKMSAIEVGYFAHYEPALAASEHFFRVASVVDYCVCHAARYEHLLKQNGVSRVTTISPGVDLDRFVPRVKIGVVGRTYHTGRKGEHLVASVMDIPGIDWHFTGEGWPLAAKPVAEEELPSFYRDMDYILVSSLYEGGPMCVVEALACGTPVIGPDVGWVSEFPHIPFKVGDTDDLRRVLLYVLEDKSKLRRSVVDRTWDQWASRHHSLFQRLLGDVVTEPPPVARPQSAQRLGLLMHGAENSTLGGPTVRVPRLGQELRERGWECACGFSKTVNATKQDLIHYFNVWSPSTALQSIRYGKSIGLPLVFSPIYLDLSRRDYWQNDVPEVFSGALDPDEIDLELSRLKKKEEFKLSIGVRREPLPGFDGMVREMLYRADHVIFLSEHERNMLALLGAVPQNSTLVRNPLQADLWHAAEPDLFKNTYGLSDYIICVARIEPRKNQLMLLHALRDLSLPIVLVGHRPAPAYFEMLKARASSNVHLIERLEPNSPMLASAVRGARVFVLPSWAEGAPLSALEAAASGTSLVLSNASGEREYLGNRARYCDPGDPSSIREQVLLAYHESRPAAHIADQRAFIADSFSWAKHVDLTQAVYREVLSRAKLSRNFNPTSPPANKEKSRLSVIMDVTTSANRRGRWTGIARVEMALAKALSSCDVDLNYVAWNDSHRSFVSVPAEAMTPDLLGLYVGQATKIHSLEPANGSHFIVAGSAWMQSTRYPPGVSAFIARYDLIMSLIIYDLVPLKFPFWFDKDYSPVFIKNLDTMLSLSDGIVAISQSTKSDIVEYSAQMSIEIPTIGVIELGDEISLFNEFENEGPSSRLSGFTTKGFVLSVGAIHRRKNQDILCDVWIRLRKKLGNRCPVLIIVGGVAWNGADVARRINEDSRLRGFVLILDNIEDNDLEWLYRNCILTVYPSLYEGWGLPVAESLRHGKICLASSESSIPEIAPGLTDLIDPLSVSDWTTKLHFYLGSKSARELKEGLIRSSYKVRTWEKAALNLVTMLYSISKRVGQYALGSIIDFSKGDSRDPFLSGGWSPAESWGSWTVESEAALELQLVPPPLGDLILIAKTNHLRKPSSPFECDVVFDDQIVATWRLSKPGLETRTAMISVHSGSTDNIRIVLRNRALRKPSDVISKSQDHRSLGIGIAQLSFVAARSASMSIRTYLEDADFPSSPQAYVGQTYDFLKHRHSRCITTSCTNSDPAWGLFDEGGRLSLEFLIFEDITSDLMLVFEIRAVASIKEKVAAEFFSGGVAIHSAVFEADVVDYVEVMMPRDLAKAIQPFTIDIVSEVISSPADLCLGRLDARFSIGLMGVSVRLPASRSINQVDYQLRQVLSFGTEDCTENSLAASAFTGLGWNAAESFGSWTRANTACISFVTTPSKCALLLLFDEAPVAFDGKLSSDALRLNGFPAIAVDGSTTVFKVQAGALAQENILEFHCEQTACPFAHGSSDERRLGMRVGRLALVDLPPAETVSTLRSPSRPFVFPRSGRAVFPFQAIDHLSTLKSVEMEISCPGACAENPLLTEVSLNGTGVTLITFEGSDPITLSFDLGNLNPENPLLLLFETVAPSESRLDLIDRLLLHEVHFDTKELAFDEMHKPPTIGLGSVEPVFTEAPVLAAFGRGWHQPEKCGVWSCASEAAISLSLDQDCIDLCRLVFSLRVFHAPIDPALVMISLNGTDVCHRVFGSDEVEEIATDAPIQIAAGETRLDILIKVDRLIRPSVSIGSLDERELGVCVSAIGLLPFSNPAVN